MKATAKTERSSLTFAGESVADVIVVACTGETSRLIGTRSVRVAASIVVSAFIHICDSHKFFLCLFGNKQLSSNQPFLAFHVF